MSKTQERWLGKLAVSGGQAGEAGSRWCGGQGQRVSSSASCCTRLAKCACLSLPPPEHDSVQKEQAQRPLCVHAQPEDGNDDSRS